MINSLIQDLNSTKGMPKIKCFYVVRGNPVHSKVYIWSEGKKATCAFCGSANYSLNALGKKSRQREYMEMCDADEALKYFKEIKKDCIDCSNISEVAKNITFSMPSSVVGNELEDRFNLENLTYEYFLDKEPVDEIKVSLLKSKQAGADVGYGSGINWGIRPNGTKRNPNQAYIPYNVADRKKGFFPDEKKKGTEHYPLFKAVTKEKGAFYMRIAQQNGKALQTPQSNAILGEWIREKLNKHSGSFITKEMLVEYGKTYITFKKFHEEGEDIYVLEF